MSAAYDDWSKARVQEELRSRSLPDEGSSKELRERLREDDRAARSREGGADGDARGRGRGSADDGGTGADGGEPTRSGDERTHSDVGQRTRANGDQRTRARGGETARADGGEGPAGGGADENGDGAPPQRSGRALPTHRIIRRAVREVAAITGRQATDVVGLRRADAGWRVTVEVLDSARVPSSGDLLSAYEALVDRDGHVRSVERTSRYTREPAVRHPRMR